MDQKDNLLGVVQSLWKWRRPILTVSFAAAVGTAIISLFLSDYFKANTIFLAASPDQATPEMIAGRTNQRSQYYGSGNDIDRLLTIAESSELVDFMVDSFRLYEHYKIDSTREKAAFRVRERFFKLYNIEKTKRDAIRLSIEDKDRELAAHMANVARMKIDEVAQQLMKEGQQKAIETFHWDIEEKQRQVNTLSDTLSSLRRIYGVYSAGGQSEALTTQKSEAEAMLARNRARLNVLRNSPGVPRDSIIFIDAMVQGYEEEVKSLETRLETFNEGIGRVLSLTRQYDNATIELSESMERLTIWQSVYQSNTPAIILVEKASVPVVKSRPKRSIIVIAAGAIAFIFMSLAALLFDNYPVDWQTVTNQNKTIKKPEEK